MLQWKFLSSKSEPWNESVQFLWTVHKNSLEMIVRSFLHGTEQLFRNDYEELLTVDKTSLEMIVRTSWQLVVKKLLEMTEDFWMQVVGI